jgi:hypothetical protein
MGGLPLKNIRLYSKRGDLHLKASGYVTIGEDLHLKTSGYIVKGETST